MFLTFASLLVALLLPGVGQQQLPATKAQLWQPYEIDVLSGIQPVGSNKNAIMTSGWHRPPGPRGGLDIAAAVSTPVYASFNEVRSTPHADIKGFVTRIEDSDAGECKRVVVGIFDVSGTPPYPNLAVLEWWHIQPSVAVHDEILLDRSTEVGSIRHQTWRSMGSDLVPHKDAALIAKTLTLTTSKPQALVVGSTKYSVRYTSSFGWLEQWWRPHQTPPATQDGAQCLNLGPHLHQGGADVAQTPGARDPSLWRNYDRANTHDDDGMGFDPPLWGYGYSRPYPQFCADIWIYKIWPNWEEPPTTAPFAKCAAPDNAPTLTVTPGDGRLDASWTPPNLVSGENEQITGYELRWRLSTPESGDEAPWTAEKIAPTVDFDNDGDVDAADRAEYARKLAQYKRTYGWTAVPGRETARSHALTGLTNGTAYTVQLRAVNSHARQTARHKDGRTQTIPGAGPPTTVSGTPSAPMHTLTTVVRPQLTGGLRSGTVDPSSGDHRYAAGSSVRLTATSETSAAHDWTFVRWEFTNESGERVTSGGLAQPVIPAYTANPITVTLNATMTATAVFGLVLCDDLILVDCVVDESPSFAVQSFNADFTVGSPGSVTLPVASGGNGPLSYTLEVVASGASGASGASAAAGGLPDGLEFNPATRTLSGTPTAALSATAFTLIAADSDTNDADADRATVTVTITVNERTSPAATLALSSTSIDEDGGSSTVTATLSSAAPAGGASLTVSASGGSGYSLSTNKTLSFAAGATTSTGTVTITAQHDADTTNETVTVSAEVASGAIIAPAEVTLTITDDDKPAATLALSSTSIDEDGGSSTVTATLSSAAPAGGASLTVGASGGSGYTLSTNKTLSFAAGATSSTGVVTITARHDADRTDETVTVSASVASGDITAPADVTLTIIDDDKPAATLALSSTNIAENGGTSTVTATLSSAAPAGGASLTVSASGGSGYSLSTNKTLSFAAGATSSTGTVTITARHDADQAHETVTVSASVASGAITAPDAVTLTITDDDIPPDPPCGACESRVNGVCTSDCTDDEECFNGSCVAVCGDCETRSISGACTSDCDSDDCESCSGGVCTSTCDSDDCETCDGSGSCTSTCDSDDCETCDGSGSCTSTCDSDDCETCDGSGSCTSTCDSDDCETCDGSGSCTSTCDSDDCETCDGSGSCTSTCGTNEVCNGSGSCACASGFERVNGSCEAKCGVCQNRNLEGDCVSSCTSCQTCTNGACVAKTCGTNEVCSGGSCVCASGFERINNQGPCVAECGECENRDLEGSCYWTCDSSEVCIRGTCGNPCDIPGFPCGRQQEEGAAGSAGPAAAASEGTSGAEAVTEPARASGVDTVPAAGEATAADGHLLGGDEAAVRIVVYEDFGCTFCREFGREVIPVLEEEFIDAGTVSLEYRHLAILGEESVNAAAAAECAADQDLFWPYHDLLVGETVRTYKEHARVLQATEAGAALNLETFDACVDAGTHVAAVQAATATAWATLSGSGTARIAVPLFLVNDGFWRIGIPTMEEVRAEIALNQPAPTDGE